MKNKNTLTIQEAADLLGKDPQYIRVAIQKGIFKFGVALKKTPKSERYTYCIFTKKFEEETGIKVNEIEE